ncbi:hypothetical protein JCM4814A_82360 [Streptomyces phaeofaciens JCM 4814]|uniref:Secreted protein n=1 Tax=Streptomyces phaeofaciens TaxID=68254 RepID=A0A918HPV2_9ACTN|nr:hypothetical protein [Streptomyces phaeofaciens]GGT90126.1 hypothetical protein GCM10010226_80360 [Streptomyces phaeofaciens]
MNVSKKCAAALVTAALSGAAVFGTTGSAFAQEEPAASPVTEVLPGTAQVGGTLAGPSALPSVDGPNLDDLAMLISLVSDTCLNPLAVELGISPDGRTAAGLTPEDIAEALLEADITRVAGAVQVCVVGLATQFLGGTFSPEVTARYAQFLGIELSSLFSIGPVGPVG